jgi:hypothetical protein
VSFPSAYDYGGGVGLERERGEEEGKYQCIKNTPGLLAVNLHTALAFVFTIMVSLRTGIFLTACVPSHMGVLAGAR